MNSSNRAPEALQSLPGWGRLGFLGVYSSPHTPPSQSQGTRGCQASGFVPVSGKLWSAFEGDEVETAPAVSGNTHILLEEVCSQSSRSVLRVAPRKGLAGNLYCGSADGCVTVKHDFTTKESKVDPSFGAGGDKKACIVKDTRRVAEELRHVQGPGERSQCPEEPRTTANS